MKSNILFTILVVLIPALLSCDKEWLEEKRELSVIVPTTLKDMRLLLNANQPLAEDARIFAELSADDYVAIDDNQISSVTAYERNSYLWLPDLYQIDEQVTDWNTSYKQVMIANIILEGLEKIKPDHSSMTEYNDIKGGALFFRAKAFLNLVETFSIPYNTQTANTDRGIPLRLETDISAPIEWASVQETWNRITVDLNEAASLLKPLPTLITDASKCAAYALLARVHLYLQDYEQSLHYADLSLQLKSDLLDFNDLNSSDPYPVIRFNSETILYGQLAIRYQFMVTTLARVNNEIYESYDDHDLRKSVFFQPLPAGGYGFKGFYSGSFAVFSGFSTNEMYLTRAECHARLDNIEAAMDDINNLLEKRYKAEEFSGLQTSDKEEALTIILMERRKELLRRGLRWSDIRRLNSDSRFAKTYTRSWNNVIYELSPEQIKSFCSPTPYLVLQESTN